MGAGETWGKICFYKVLTQSFQDQIPSVTRFVCWVGRAYWMKLANLKKMWYVRMTQEKWKQQSCRCYRRPDIPFWGDINDTNPNKYKFWLSNLIHSVYSQAVVTIESFAMVLLSFYARQIKKSLFPLHWDMAFRMPVLLCSRGALTAQILFNSNSV